MRWSLKWKIQFWHGLILVVVALLLGVLFYRHEREIIIRETDWILDQSRDTLMHFASRMGTMQSGSSKKPLRPGEGWEDVPPEWKPVGFQPGSSEDAERPPHGSPTETFKATLEPQGYYYIVWGGGESDPVIKSENAPDIERPAVSPRGAWQRIILGERREIFQNIRDRSAVVGRYTESIEARLDQLKIQLLIGGAFLVGGAILIGNFLVFKSLKPLSGIRKTARDVASGKLSERIKTKAKSSSLEIAELTEDLNGTFTSLEKLFQRQTAFTADASHELRTPLTALIAQVKRGQRGDRSEQDYQHIFEICDRSLERLKHIVDDLLELSRFDSGQIELEREDMALDLLVSTIVEDYRPMVEEQASLLHCEIASCSAFCDPFRIEQVISNFITNALNHNREPVSISLSTRLSGDFAVIEVEDNGVGIPAEHHEYLFDRFYQEKKSKAAMDTRKNSKNSGLGLAISKAIVEAHGGSISVRSQPGEFTVFVIRLPVETEEVDE